MSVDLRCKKCLLAQASQEETLRKINLLVAEIDPAIRSIDTLYQHRLQICQQCDHLLNGMCIKCGCFVELRAAINGNRCPDSHKYW